MAEMCEAGLHKMTPENQHVDGLGRKAGCKGCLRNRGKLRNDLYCKNWHARTDENTHVDERGLRHCKQCPTWPAYAERLARKEERERPRLSEKDLRRLRASVPCVVCGEIPREVTVMMRKKDQMTGLYVDVATIAIKIPHWPTCPVPHNREGDGKGPGRPRKRRDQTRTCGRPDTPCARCGEPVKQPWPKRTVKYCGATCKSYASREGLTKVTVSA